MAKRARGQKAAKAKNNITKTSGEIFPDGSIIELVAAASEERLDLLLWEEGSKTIAPQVEYRGCVYQAVDLPETTRRAIRFPVDAKSYDRELFIRVLDLFGRYVGVSRSEAALLTAWTTTTWFADQVSSPPALVISGPAMDHAITLLRLLSCVCRRPVILADINQAALFSLMSLPATLLVNYPGLSAKIRDLWSRSNYRGVHVFGNGKVLQVVGSKGIYSGMKDGWDGSAIHLALPPARTELPPLEHEQLAEIGNDFQPRFLMYRLSNLRRVRESHVGGPQRRSPTSVMARDLAVCIEGEQALVNAVTPLLERQEQDTRAQRSCDPKVAIIEVLWFPSHQNKEIAVSRVTDLTNALLRCRGERVEYVEEEIGWKLKDLGLYRHRNGSGMMLRFSKDNCVRIHQMDRCFGLSLPAVDGCVDCAGPDEIAAPGLV